DVLGTLYPSLEPVDSSTPSSAPLSRCTLLRHPSFGRAVCVDAPVRIWAGGDPRWSSLPRQEPLQNLRGAALILLLASCTSADSLRGKLLRQKASDSLKG